MTPPTCGLRSSSPIPDYLSVSLAQCLSRYRFSSNETFAFPKGAALASGQVLGHCDQDRPRPPWEQHAAGSRSVPEWRPRHRHHPSAPHRTQSCSDRMPLLPALLALGGALRRSGSAIERVQEAAALQAAVRIASDVNQVRIAPRRLTGFRIAPGDVIQERGAPPLLPSRSASDEIENARKDPVAFSHA